MSQVEDRSLDPMLARRYYGEGCWRAEDLWASFEEVASRAPEAAAFVDADRVIRFGELHEQAARFGRAALARGHGDGEIVVIHGRNCLEAVVAMLGCAWANLVFALIPPMFSARHINSILDNTRCRMMVGLGDSPDLERARAAVRNHGVSTLVVADWHATAGGEVAWSEFIRSGADGAGRERKQSPDDLALLIFSSGTTGTPKGVMHSANTARYAAKAYAELHAIRQADVCLIVLEFGFVGSSVLGVFVPLLKGCTGVLLRHWSVDESLELIERHRITHIFLMPTHAIDILSSPALDATDCSSVARGVVAGLSVAHRQDARRRLCALPFPMYGMSESPGHVTGAMDDNWEQLRSTEGRPLPGAEVVICDDDGAVLPAGVKGHILVRGPNRFLGYYRDPDLTAHSLTGQGYFRTGDIGFVNEAGYMTFVSRNKDIIRRGGVTVVPAEVEEALRKHPRIRDVAVIGVPDARLGERACACVITRDGKRMELEEITGFLEQHAYARYIWPEFVYSCKSFPRTPSLKVKKKELKDEVLATMPELER